MQIRLFEGYFIVVTYFGVFIQYHKNGRFAASKLPTRTVERVGSKI